MATLDRADWHSGGEFPEDLPEEAGGTHIGIYLNWLIDRDLIGDELLEECSDGIAQVKAGKLSGRDFLFEYCDGKLWSEMLNAEGEAFSSKYYGGSVYYDDYTEVLTEPYDSLYEVPNTRENYVQIVPTLDARFERWTKRREKRFWQFWK